MWAIRMTDYRRVKKLYEELDTFIRSLQGLFVDTLLGFELIEADFKAESNRYMEVLRALGEACDENLSNETGVSYKKLSGEAIPASGLFTYSKKDVKARIKTGGMNHHFICIAVVTALVSYWEHYLRKEVRLALADDNYNSPFWQDLTLLRNALVHRNLNQKTFRKNAQLAFFKNLSKQKRLVLTDVVGKDLLLLTCAFRNQLHTLSFPTSMIRVPRT